MKINGKSLLLALCLYLPIGIYAGSGDVNGDKKLTYADVEAIINYIMGNNPENFDAEAANVNDDNTINIADAVALMNKIKVTISMNGQTQKGNNSDSHLTTHGYITDFKPAELPPLDLNPLFCVLHLTIDVPQGDYKSIILQTDNKLTTEATLSLTTGELTPTTTSAVQALTLKNVQLSEGQNTLEAYLSILPCDLSTSQLSIKVYDAEGNLYNVSGNFGGKTFEAGTTYHLTGAISSSAIALCSGLPVIMVNTPSGVKISDITKETWLEGSTMAVFNIDGQVLNAPGKIKGRGNSTWTFDKKPYAFKFSQKQSPFGFPSNKAWVLLAESCDRSLLRTAYMCAISKAVGIDWTINYQYVNLFLNGEYWGVYVLTDKVEKSKNRINIKDDGFIIEDDNFYEQESLYWVSDRIGRPYTFKYPDPDDNEIVQFDDNFLFIRDFISEIERTLKLLNDNAFNTDYLDKVDANSFAKYHIAEEVFSNFDPNRYYVLPSRTSKLKMMPMWDSEWSLGLWRSNWGNPPLPIVNNCYWEAQYYFKYLFRSPSFKSEVKTEWETFKTHVEEIKSEVNSVRLKIAKAQSDNFKKWPNPGWPLNIKFDTWEEEADYLKDFLDERIAFLDNRISKW